MNNVPIPNWFDFLVIIVVLLGANKGRKNGMSQELISTLQWGSIIAACALLYRPLGDLLAQSSPMSHIFCYIVCYIGTALIVRLVFVFIKKSTGGKLLGSDVFGGAEFYLGMAAGAFRFLCILLAGMALLNARYYSNQEVTKAVAFQNDMYGSTFFPELYSIQAVVFKESIIGKAVTDYAPFLLIKPTRPEVKGIERRKDDLP
jgi:uncharacterized membrane protein required for colicin V production